MTTSIDRADLRELTLIGATAGLVFAGFELVATAVVTGSAVATPLRMIGAIVLGPGALDSSSSFAAAAVIGLTLHLILSVTFAAIFVALVRRIARATEGELLITSGQVALAGIVFGAVLWLVNFYVIARLAGWAWFPGNVHHVIAFVGYAFFFGAPLGWMAGRSGIATSQLRRSWS